MQRNPHSDLNNSDSALSTLEALNRADANVRGEGSQRSSNKASSVRSRSTSSGSSAQRSSLGRSSSQRSSSQSRQGQQRRSSQGRPASSRAPQSSSSRNAGAVSSQRRNNASQSRKAEMQRNLKRQKQELQAKYASYDERQRPSGSKKKKNKKGFKKFILIYSIILVIILIVGLIIFNSFIATYENNQPVNIAKNVAEELSGDNAKAYLDKNKDNIKTLENVDTLIDKAVENIAGNEVSFIQSDDYTETDPSYNLTANGTQIGKLTLEADGTGAFGLKKWKIKNLDVVSYIPNTYSYTILSPTEDTVYVNGTELSEEFITAKDEVPTILENVQDLLETVPKYDSYTVNGFLSVPTVTATDASGSDVGVAASTESFVVGGKPDQSFIDEQKDFVENALTAWAYHFINYGGSSSLSTYVMSDTDLYAYIFGSDTMDPIYTAFYDWEYISDVQFTEFSADNYIKYTDDCYSVDVKYQLNVSFNNGNPVDDDQQLDATWVIVRKNGTWGIADIQYHQSGDSSLADSVNSSSESSSTSDDASDETTTSSTDETTASTDETTTSSTDETTASDADETIN